MPVTHPGRTNMPIFTDNFGFKEIPFEQYVAEREPRINEYAVKPSYFEETRRRVKSVSSYILFGFRGSGKSATRITTEKETWKEIGEGTKGPLMVSMIDFDVLLKAKKVEEVELVDIVRRVAFLTVEGILLWISNQEEKDQLLELLDDGELNTLRRMAKTYYLNEPEADREVSQFETMRILQQNWVNYTGDWINRKWSSIATVVGKVSSALVNWKLSVGDISREVSDILSKDGSGQSIRGVLQSLVEMAQSFGFTGICVLVDKVDEHPKTQRSTEDSARLVYPIISQVQFMELEGFAWIFFLWDKIKPHLSSEKLSARLDKYAHSEVAWPKEYLDQMIQNRVSYFSDGKIKNLSELCDKDTSAADHLDNIISLVQHSPRELIRLLDIITREFNSNYAHEKPARLLSNQDFEVGQDVYVRDVMWTVYDNKILSQLLRFNNHSFTNKDVQQAFRISSAGARGRIQSWEASGAVGLSVRLGTS